MRKKNTMNNIASIIDYEWVNSANFTLKYQYLLDFYIIMLSDAIREIL
jgi:hypothetical protein